MDNLLDLIDNTHEAINEWLRGPETEDERLARLWRHHNQNMQELQRRQAVVFQIQRFQIINK